MRAGALVQAGPELGAGQAAGALEAAAGTALAAVAEVLDGSAPGPAEDGVKRAVRELVLPFAGELGDAGVLIGALVQTRDPAPRR